MSMSSTVETLLAFIRSTTLPVGGPLILGGLFAVLFGLARASWLSNRNVFNRIWLPVQPGLAASPSASDTLITGVRAAVRAIGAFVVMLICGFLAIDLIFFQGEVTLILLVSFGL